MFHVKHSESEVNMTIQELLSQVDADKVNLLYDKLIYLVDLVEMLVYLLMLGGFAALLKFWIAQRRHF